jgi:hypothetical protein
MGGHFDKFVDHELHILQGHANIYVFQSRIFPPLEISTIGRILSVDFTTASYIFYRSMLVLISLTFGLFLCRPWDLGFSMAAIRVVGFSACNISVINAGYWLVGFDLQNELCVIIMFGLFLVELRPRLKLLAFCILAVVWQFTMEEVIYIPLLYLLAWNLDALLAMRLRSVLFSRKNWLFVLLIGASLAITNYTRHLLFSGSRVDGSVMFLGQWVVLRDNRSAGAMQLRALLHPARTLRDGYWWVQGFGVFVLLNVCALLYVLPSNSRATTVRVIFAMFLIMSIITLTFARLEETNALLPMVVAVFALQIAAEAR